MPLVMQLDPEVPSQSGSVESFCLVRVPPSHLSVHSLQEPHSPHGGQTSKLQYLVSYSGSPISQSSPEPSRPPSRQVRWRLCVPPPQVRSHVPHSDHSLAFWAEPNLVFSVHNLINWNTVFCCYLLSKNWYEKKTLKGSNKTLFFLTAILELWAYLLLCRGQAT